MKLKPIVALALLAGMGGAYGAAGVFGSYINITSSNLGGTPTWYDAQVPGGGRASDPTDFNGLNFGAFDPGTGATLNLTGAEVLTYKNGGSDVTAATIYYRIYPAGSPAGAFSPINVAWTTGTDIPPDYSFHDAAGTTFVGGASVNQQWSNGVGSTSMLTGLGNGDYVLDVYLTATEAGYGEHFSNNGGSNYQATFSVVPEPASAALALLGGLAFLRRRRG